MSQFYLYDNQYLVDVIFENDDTAVVKWIDYKPIPDDLAGKYPEVSLSMLSPAQPSDLEDMITVDMSSDAMKVLEQKQKEWGMVCIAHVIVRILKEKLNLTDE